MYVKIMTKPNQMTMHFLSMEGDPTFTHFLKEGQIVHYGSKDRHADWKVPESRDYSVAELRKAVGLD